MLLYCGITDSVGGVTPEGWIDTQREIHQSTERHSEDDERTRENEERSNEGKFQLKSTAIPSQGPRHTKDVIKMVPVVPLFGTQH